MELLNVPPPSSFPGGNEKGGLLGIQESIAPQLACPSCPHSVFYGREQALIATGG